MHGLQVNITYYVAQFIVGVLPVLVITFVALSSVAICIVVDGVAMVGCAFLLRFNSIFRISYGL